MVQGSGKISINRFTTGQALRLQEPNMTPVEKAAMNAAIIQNTKKPPQLRGGYNIDIMEYLLVAGVGFEPTTFRL